ncbi:BON domain-containing protein [Pelagicoccus sp. SDUM812005]|uniref:BON domain-containing protein n=1 Tax=Pelagicoccus sp. SDUM812005 TaxID=3041257 RepID=UPI00280FA8B8|nr:BON domain-containing protein [Pelagicoccus sp. SDUM812005]MDQ8181540.1 BON domain-containing protein [Pelagicoccus sp. SDUM812005]
MKSMRTTHPLQWLSAAFAISLFYSLHAAADSPESLPDAEINRAIEEKFRVDPVVPYNDIDVYTLEGIVNLEGETQNLLAKRRASLVAETVKGARAVTNRIKVKPPESISAADLKESIEDAFLYDPVADAYEIEVHTQQDGTVRLTGEVDSQQESELAARVAMGVNGVTQLHNELSVNQQTRRPDHETKAEIESLLAWNTLVDDVLIDVHVRDGVVKLNGTVGSLTEKRQAEKIAWVGGIKEVDTSNLRIEHWARDEAPGADKYASKSDESIQQAINDALIYDPRIVGQDVTPEVDESWVTLSGNVDNLLAKESAETIAHNTVGVNGVTNRIEIRSEKSFDEQALTDIITSKLDRDPLVRSDAVNVSVRGSTVRLTGVVDSLFEKARCETLAQSTLGATEIKNDIKVTEQKPAIAYVPNRSLDDLSTAIHDGAATLLGKVESQKEKYAATENAIEGGPFFAASKIVVDS